MAAFGSLETSPSPTPAQAEYSIPNQSNSDSLVPHRASHHHCHLSSNSGGSTGSVHGFQTHQQRFFFKASPWEFTLNPGPFNVKEHVLITIFANSGAGTVYAIHIVTVVKVFYRKHISFFVSFLVVITTQVLGFGWAGIFRKYLVEPAPMWWPANLVQVSLFRALHEKEERAINT